MPGCIHKTFLKLQHPTLKNPEDALFTEYTKQFRAKVQFSKEEDGTPALSVAATKLLQKNIGNLLFYGRSVNTMFLVSLITQASKQVHVTEATDIAMVHLLNY